MQSTRGLLIALLLMAALLIVATAGTTTVQAQDDDNLVRHTIQPGENLYRIAQQYGVTVFAIAEANDITNPNIITVGDVLIIPVSQDEVDDGQQDGEDQATETPAPVTPVPTTATPEPPAEFIYTVGPQDNLYRIATQFGTTVRAIVELNNLVNPNLIHVGNRLRIPSDATNLPGDAGEEVTPTPQPVPTETELPTAEPIETDETVTATTEPAPEETETATEAATETATEPAVTPTTPAPTVDIPQSSAGPAIAFSYGVEVNLFGQNKNEVLADVTALGVSWVKQTVEWEALEPTQGNIIWAELDEIVSQTSANGLNLMLTITNAPAWARGNDLENGPPVDNQDFATFVGAVAARYRGSVDAYEIWDEPNIRSQWNGAAYGKPLSAAGYAELVRVAYDAVQTADPDAIVITAGLRPSGLTNDDVIEDRAYLRQMYQAGIGEFSDAIGVHPLSAANPPDSICCENNPEILGWDDHPSFFFLDTLRDYRAIMNENGDQGKFLWVTQFGWGSSDGLSISPPESLGFVAFTTLDEQADYTVRAFQKGRELGYVGPMFVWSLNLCQTAGIGSVECYWGLQNPAGDARPVYNVLSNTPK